MASIHYIIYMSAATGFMKDDDLLTLLNECQEKNSINDISGILLYKDGSFMQYIEGEQKNIKALYNKICWDKRHRHVIKIQEGNSRERIFEGWTMGFYNMDKTESLPTFDEFIYDTVDFNDLKKKPSVAYRLLMSFRQTA